MASVTLAESAKLAQDELVSGVIETVITVNRFFEVLPFDGIDGNALAYNRENVLGEVVTATVGGDLSTINQGSGVGAAKKAATFTQVTSNLTTIIGDAEVNGLIQATRSGDGNDQKAVQVASKAKSTGRKYQEMFVIGDNTVENQFDGLIQILTDAGATREVGGVNGGALTFLQMDELMDLVVDKDGEVDYLQAAARTIREYKALLRALGGAAINEVVQLPSGAEVPAYSGAPLFRNDYIPTDQDKGTATASTGTTMFAGTLDDGSRSMGIAGLTAAKAAGIQVVEVGESETKDESITRVKWYSGLANFSEKGVARLTGIGAT